MAGFRLTHEERVALTFIAHNDPRDGFVRRTWLEFKTAICGLLQRTRGSGWISVSDLPPSVDEYVLACSPSGDVHVARLTDEEDDMKQRWMLDGGGDVTVKAFTHWMPLPEPPRHA